MSTGTPQALYRFWDAAGDLLYVGITNNPGTRWPNHMRTKPWWSEVASITLETHVDRAAAEAAERAAISTEHPRYNIIYSRRSSGPAPALVDSYYAQGRLVVARSRRSDFERTGRAGLWYEVNCDPMSDDYLPDEISARELFDLWVRYHRQRGNERIHIFWYVDSRDCGVFEGAIDYGTGSFLDYYLPLIDATTGDHVRLEQLPVFDKNWSRCANKGGFLPEVTGWKPMPWQDHVDLSWLVTAASINADR